MKVKGRSYYLGDLPWKYSHKSPFHTPIFFFDQCVAEIIAFSWSIVLMGKALYQSAFLSFENCLNSIVVGSEAEHTF